MTMLAVFASRAQALDAVQRLRTVGVNVRPVSTPPDAGCGCGLSLRFEGNAFPRVRAVLAARRYSAFRGYFRVCGGSYLRV